MVVYIYEQYCPLSVRECVITFINTYHALRWHHYQMYHICCVHSITIYLCSLPMPNPYLWLIGISIMSMSYHLLGILVIMNMCNFMWTVVHGPHGHLGTSTRVFFSHWRFKHVVHPSQILREFHFSCSSM